jgi:hypothetical protein
MSLLDHRTAFGNFGIVIRDAPSAAHPALPDGAYPVLALPVPAGQIAALEEFDGIDPTEDEVPPVGRRLRRILRHLVRDDDVLAWRLVREGANAWLHLQVTQAQARQWFRWIDWEASTRVPGPPRTGHVFFGV